MVSGQFYNPLDPEICEARAAARDWMARYNASDPRDITARTEMLQAMLGSCGKRAFMEPRVTFDYGLNLHVGDDFYCNFDCIFLDEGVIRIGNRVMLGPGVHIYTAKHPLPAVVRNGGKEYTAPVTIGDDVWVGGGAIICPGVTVGHRAVIAAGAVVVKDVPDDAVVGGNPARIIRMINQSERPVDWPWN